MQFNKIIAGSLLTLGAVTSACQSDNIEIPKSELYTREFIKEFGVVDPNHDWNNAAQGSVTVVTSSPTHVEVLADIKGKRYIFADYRKVNGTETINFTIPKGISNIIVSLNGREVNTTLGATVNASRTGASRTAHYGDSDPVITVSQTEEKEWLVLSAHDALLYSKRMPEGEFNVYNEGVTSDFIFQSEGDFIVYPIYWQTSNTPEFGFYYYDSNSKTIVRVPVYTADKTAENDATESTILVKRDGSALKKDKGYTDSRFADIAVKYGLGSDANNYQTNITNEIDGEVTKICNELLTADGVTDFLVHRWYYYGNGYCHIHYTTNKPYITSPQDEHKGVGTGNAAHYDPEAYNVVISKGIKVHIKPGTPFGAYIVSGGNTFYSNRERNEGFQLVPVNPDDPNDKSKKIGEPLVGPSHAATWTGKKYGWTMLAFEDWKTNFTLDENNKPIGHDNDSDYDLNDFVFMLAGANPEVIPEGNVETPPTPEPEKYSFLLAAEDLGGTCDWDFNDLVAEVSVVAKNYIEAEEGVENSTASNPYKEVTVTPLASGGTLPIYLMYTGKVSKPEGDYNSYTPATYLIGREFHSWLTNSQGSSLTPLNVGASATLKGKSITFHIPEKDYTLASDKKYSASEGSNNMGGFWVLVINHEDTPYTPEIIDENYLSLITNIPDGKGITKIEAPQPDLNLGNIAPQMLCIGHEWLWPRESKKIHSAYPGDSGFTGWLNNESFTDWYGTGKYVESLVTKRDL